jgi:hypothetical protein
VNTNIATMVQLELKCTAHCTLCPYETPELESELAMWLWEMHWAENHPQALTDSMMLPVVQSIPAKDFYGLHTKSLPVGIKAKVNRKSSEEAALKTSMETALKTSQEAALKTSQEAANKTETMCSSKELARNESLCISRSSSLRRTCPSPAT